jgi:hypothetical protein
MGTDPNDVVVGVDGAWYVLSRGEAPTASRREAIDMFLIEFDRLADEDSDLPLRERTHRI